jgi:hypothetical protein
MDDFSGDLVKSVESSGLSDIAKDYGEKGLDNLISAITDNDAVKEIPIIKSIIGLYKGAIALRDRNYVKKIFQFLFQVDKSSPEAKKKFREKIQSSPEEVQKAGETVWDRVTSGEKAAMIGKVFEAYMSEEINLDQLIYLCEIIEKTYLQDLISLEKSEIHNDINLENVGIKKPLRVEDINKLLEEALQKAAENESRNLTLVSRGISPTAPKFPKLEQPGLTDEGYSLMRILRSY